MKLLNLYLHIILKSKSPRYKNIEIISYNCDKVRASSGVEEQELEMKYMGWCGQAENNDGIIIQEYNPLASYFWAGEGKIIRNIL